MEFVVISERREAAAGGRPAYTVEEECETWDWVRAAGVSAEALREAIARVRAAQPPS